MSTPLHDPIWLRSRVEHARAATEMVIADCDALIAQRMDAQLAEARRQSTRFRKLADDYDRLIENLEGFQNLPGEVLAVLNPAVMLLAFMAERLWGCFEDFERRHPPLVDEDLRSRLQSSTAWAVRLPSVVAPLVDEYIARLQEGLEAINDENTTLAEEWGTIVGEAIQE